MRIMYIEDNPANLFLVKRVARMGNHEVINYIDGQTALEKFEGDNPSLVLIDIQLSGELSGLDVVKTLRKAGHKTPVVAVTAYAMMGDRERCLEAGCDDYLAKPMPVPALVDLIKRYDSASASGDAVESDAKPVLKAESIAEKAKAETIEAPAVPTSEPNAESTGAALDEVVETPIDSIEKTEEIPVAVETEDKDTQVEEKPTTDAAKSS